MSHDDDLDDQMTVLDGGSPVPRRRDGSTESMDEARTVVADSGLRALAAESLSDRFAIIGELGKGGMGVVYKAQDRKLGRTVALKCLRPEGVANERAVQRFWREAKAIASLNHFNIVQIYNVLDDKKNLWIEMEYLSGGSLKDRIEKEGPLPEQDVIEIGIQLAEALDEAHRKGIFHRDVKPGNILLTDRGTPKLSDFGLAQHSENAPDMTVHGTMIGTMFYAAPEQLVSGKNVDGRSDVYGLGATLYTAATGEMPRAIRLEKLPGALRPILAKCLEEPPDKRFQSAADLAAALAAKKGAPVKDSAGQVCSACGYGNPEKVRFCQKCGQGLAMKMERCPKCRIENRENAEFCGNCGINIALALKAGAAQTAFLEGRMDRATAVWKDILDHDPDFTVAREGLEKVQYLKKEVATFLKKAHASLETGDKETAFYCFDKVLSLDASHKEARQERDHLASWVVEQRLRRARTFLAAMKYEKAHEQLQSVLDLDEFNKPALDLLEKVSRHYKPKAGKRPLEKTLPAVSMGMSTHYANKGVYTIIALGIVTLFLILIWMWPSASPKDKTGAEAASIADRMAFQTVKNAHTASQAYFVDHPDEDVSMKAMLEYGFKIKPLVSINILNASGKKLNISAFHRDGRNIYAMDKEGSISVKTKPRLETSKEKETGEKPEKE